MKKIYSNINLLKKNTLIKVIKLLKKKQIVALPTETVYGLAGNAYSESAVKKIFKLKKRPKKNPLIIHYSNLKNARKDVCFNGNFLKLYRKFCPGPITFVLKKKRRSKINNYATSNLKTVAIRFPKNSRIRKILKKLNFPLAMPSANKSKGISPISPEDVYDEFKNKIKIIVDGGKCRIGLESTVVDLSDKIKILRPGYISLNDIKKTLKRKVDLNKNQKKIISPGMMKLHYSPGIPVILNQKKAGKNVAFITFGKKYSNSINNFNLSKKSNLDEAARNLYKVLREIKSMKFKKIHVVKIPNIGIGAAINDRLKHAAYKK
tara:strand:+ start:679 stop:1638 length:960 start_codon:yes stop_codon:yes gene_type:complete